MVKVYCKNCSSRCVGDVLKVGNSYFHQSCFKCYDCKKKLDTGGFYCRNGNYFCNKDYTKRFSNTCFICNDIIQNDIVSALNKHFHKDCFKCNTCSKKFSPGDRVMMKSDKFVCENCVSPVKRNKQDKIESKQLQLQHSFDEATTTDQGYISADPTSLSSPIQNEELNNVQKHDDEPSSEEATISTKRRPVKLSSSLSRLKRQFQFGQFYNKSYLSMQHPYNQSQQARNNKTIQPLLTIQQEMWNKGIHATNSCRNKCSNTCTVTDSGIGINTVTTTATNATGTPHCDSRKNDKRYASSGVLVAKNNRIQRQHSGGLYSMFSMPRLQLCKSQSLGLRAGYTIPEHGELPPESELLYDLDQEEYRNKENVLKLATYPSATLPSENENEFVHALDREDWPAPPYSAIVYREQMLQKILAKEAYEMSQKVNQTAGMDTSIQSKQSVSMDHLVPTTAQKLIKILYGPDKGNSLRQLNHQIISESRAPDAKTEPGQKTRFINHTDKSNSRDLLYFHTRDRKKFGFSMDYISSTSRPFLARCFDKKRDLETMSKGVNPSVSHNPIYSLPLSNQNNNSNVNNNNNNNNNIDDTAPISNDNKDHLNNGCSSVETTVTSIISQLNQNNSNNNNNNGGGGGGGVGVGLWSFPDNIANRVDCSYEYLAEYDGGADTNSLVSTVSNHSFRSTSMAKRRISDDNAARTLQPPHQIDSITGLRVTQQKRQTYPYTNYSRLGKGRVYNDATIQHQQPHSLLCRPQKRGMPSYYHSLTATSHKTAEMQEQQEHEEGTEAEQEMESIVTELSTTASTIHTDVAGTTDNNVEALIIPFVDLVNRTRDGKMRGIDMDNLEKYLSIDEFEMIFGLNRSDFQRLPIWKRNDLKKRVGLF